MPKSKSKKLLKFLQESEYQYVYGIGSSKDGTKQVEIMPYFHLAPQVRE